MSTVKVGAIRGVSASSDAITVANDGSCTANITNNLSNRNLVINGAMEVAQRATSSTGNGYQSLDRFAVYVTNVGTTVTKSQQDLSSSDTPYSLGFRKFHRTALSGAGTAAADSEVIVLQNIEAQNIATSGWNYTSTSSYVTVQFWFRCSTNQTFYFYLETKDGTPQSYPISFTASGNNTWTKITQTFPGNSNVQIDNDNGEGLLLVAVPFYGTNRTDDSKSLNQWSAFTDAARTPDYASTWLTAGASTFDITGVQLEVGEVATDFEHRSFGQELQLCKRYYQKSYPYSVAPGTASSPAAMIISRYSDEVTNRPDLATRWEVEMRATPTLTTYRPFSGGATQVENFGSGIGTVAGNGRSYTVQNLGATGFGGFTLISATSNTIGYHYQVDAEL